MRWVKIFAPIVSFGFMILAGQPLMYFYRPGVQFAAEDMKVILSDHAWLHYSHIGLGFWFVLVCIMTAASSQNGSMLRWLISLCALGGLYMGYTGFELSSGKEGILSSYVMHTIIIGFIVGILLMIWTFLAYKREKKRMINMS